MAGVQAGDRVALILPNCPQHIAAFYAILRLGAVVVERITSVHGRGVAPHVWGSRREGRDRVG